jgi:quercetin dioxygenase-like cupin family protein
MHLVRTVDWTLGATPDDSVRHSSGYLRQSLVDRTAGATHTELGIERLAADGHVGGHVHAFEEAVYVLGGEPTLAIDDRRLRLRSGDFALLPIGQRHSWHNGAGEEARWLSVSTPLRTAPDEARPDTFFSGACEAADGPAAAPVFGPTSRLVGHYDGTPPQAEALELTDPARGRRPAGRDTALVVYSGISVKMLVDPTFGADLLTMFTVDYEPKGSAQVHDHPFEEAYFFLEGEIDAVLEGREYVIRAGDVVFAGVGAAHGFFNTGDGRVRWIETQAPQPPVRHSYRWVDTWKRYEQGLVAAAKAAAG